MSFFSHVSTYFREGGIFMIPIVIVGIITLAIAIERLWVVSRAASLDGKKLARDLEGMIARGDVLGGMQLCRRIPSPVARVAHDILERGVSDEATLRAVADDAASVALPPLGRRLSHLSLLANVVTLLGLLGTILGLTTAFSAVAAADPTQRSVFLARGISEALNATSMGLMIAVPTLLTHGFLASRVEGVADQVDEMAVTLIRALGRKSRPATTGAREAA